MFRLGMGLQSKWLWVRGGTGGVWDGCGVGGKEVKLRTGSRLELSLETGVKNGIEVVKDGGLEGPMMVQWLRLHHPIYRGPSQSQWGH